MPRSGWRITVGVTTVWIRDRFPNSAEFSGLLVMPSGWMLEMVRFEDSRTFGLFLGAFGVVHFNTPEFKSGLNAEFVGYSRPGPPPADWLKFSMIFAMGAIPLAETPEELVALVEKPRPYTVLEMGLHASPLSRKVKLRIAETFSYGLSISEIACELGVSHAHLARQFRRDFGLTPVSYRNHLRINEAIERLSNGEQILDIGYEVGFNDTGRFYKDFRKVTGTSPGKCRTLIKKRQDSNHNAC
jgi:AraC-like DNA-binding protein